MAASAKYTSVSTIEQPTGDAQRVRQLSQQRKTSQAWLTGSERHAHAAYLGCVVLVFVVALVLPLTLILIVAESSDADDSGNVVMVFLFNGTQLQQQQQQHSLRLLSDTASFHTLLANGPRIRPTYMGMKFLAMYLYPDYDTVHFQNNYTTGLPQTVWLNPECEPFGNDCTTANVTRFFNFTSSLSSINRELNSQNRTIAAGTYRYVSVTMCKHQLVNGSDLPDTDDNFRWQAGNMSVPFATVSDNCGIWSARAEPPIEINKSKTTTVFLTFSLDDICAQTTTTTESSRFCATVPRHTLDDGTTTANAICCDVPHFVPSFVIA